MTAAELDTFLRGKLVQDDETDVTEEDIKKFDRLISTLGGFKMRYFLLDKIMHFYLKKDRYSMSEVVAVSRVVSNPEQDNK